MSPTRAQSRLRAREQLSEDSRRAFLPAPRYSRRAHNCATPRTRRKSCDASAPHASDRRFTAKDPILFRGRDTNLYAYVGNDPINRVDPSGLAPGDIYATMDDAAWAALWDINATSIGQNREWGGFITDNYDGTYSYDFPRPGFEGILNLGDPPGNACGDYHTHGAYDRRYDNENFSVEDKSGAEFMGWPIYLGTPEGWFKKYSPGVP